MNRILIAVLFLTTLTENEIADTLAPKYDGQREYRLWDNTRVDLLTPTHAIEIDVSSKWAEGIGQALYYAEVTGKKPGVILLVKNKTKEARYIYRLQTVAAKYDIDWWIEEKK